MNRSHAWVASAAVTFTLAVSVAGCPGAANAVEPDELAPPGVCAGEQRELRKGPVQADAADGATTRGLARVHVTPIDVAFGPPTPGGPRPVPPSFSGPGPCDRPGSGCLGAVRPAAPTPPTPRFTDPDPTGGCNFPGCSERPLP